MHDRFLLHKRYKDLTAQQLLILESWLGQFPRLAAVYWRKVESPHNKFRRAHNFLPTATYGLDAPFLLW